MTRGHRSAKEASMANSDLIFDKTYNERLFTGGLRGWFHLARFHWLRRQCLIQRVDTCRVVELGCYDARSVDYLPTKPAEYFGYDAGVEDGLKLAIEKYRNQPNYVFQQCTTADQMRFPSDERATVIVSLETIEHVPATVLPGYLARFQQLLDGHLIISVPNEKGLVFLVKWIVKTLFYPGRERYTVREVIAATRGDMSRVHREEHKGFDWEVLRGQLEERFDLIKVEGVQFPGLPAFLNVQIGMVFRSRRAVAPSGTGRQS
jgi:hypothetical protein